MTILSKGYCSDLGIEDTEWQLFCQHIDLLLKHKQTILTCSDYFFCCLSFAAASFPYLQGDGQLALGHLILGWEQSVLIERCPTCECKVLITSFAGSPLSGCNSWTGLCLGCRQRQKEKHSVHFRQWMNFILKLRQAFPATIQEQQTYDGFEFNWGGTGLKPVIKTRVISKPVAKSVALELLIAELKTGNIRNYSPINISLLKKSFELKPFSRC